MARWPDLSARYTQSNITPGEGVDTARSPLLLSSGQASDMQDFSSRGYPALQVRDGRRQLYGPIMKPHICKIHVTPSGVVHIIVADPPADPFTTGADWYYFNVGTNRWTLVQAHAYDMSGYWSFDMADWYNRTTGLWDVYMVRPDGSGDYCITYWNGTAATTIAHATYAAKAGPVCSHLNRMFSATENALGQLGYSKIADPTTWTSPDGGAIPVGANDNITTMLSMPDRMFIGTDRGIYILTGDAGTNFVVTTVTNGIRIPDGNMACAFGDTVYFSDGDEVYEYSSSTGIRMITRSANGNAIYGGFAEESKDSIDTTEVSVRKIFSLGTDGNRLYVGTGADVDNSNYYPPIRVLDIGQRRWFVERGPVSVCWNLWTDEGSKAPVFAKTPYNRVVCNSEHAIGTDSAFSDAQVLWPRLYELNAGSDTDSLSNFNLCIDPWIIDVTKWVPSGGVESYGDYYTVTGNGTQAYLLAAHQTVHPCVSGNKIAFTIQARQADASCTSIQIGFTGSGGGSGTIQTLAGASGLWDSFAAIGTLTGAYSGDLIVWVKANYANAAAANGKTLEIRMCLVDDLSFAYGVGSEPATIAAYQTEYPVYSWTSVDGASTASWFATLNEALVTHYRPSFYWYSPWYQIRADAKKTLKNIWVTAELTGADTFAVQVYNGVGSAATVYTKSGTPSTTVTNTKIKVPVSARDKSEWTQIRIIGTGQAKITNIALDWRVVARES